MKGRNISWRNSPHPRPIATWPFDRRNVLLFNVGYVLPTSFCARDRARKI